MPLQSKGAHQPLVSLSQVPTQSFCILSKPAFLKAIILFLLLPFQHSPTSLLVQMLMCSLDPTQFITVGSLTFIRFSGAPYPATLCKVFLPAEIIQLGNVTP